MRMGLQRLHRTMLAIGTAAAAAICGCDPDEDDGVLPPYEPCSADVVQTVCESDSARTGTYATVDQPTASFVASNNLAGCAVGVSYDREVVYLRGYGFADQQVQADTTDDAPYRIDTMQPVASVSKTITALAVLRMIQDGMLSPGADLNTPLSELLPDVGPQMGSRTLRQLLSHSSGFPATTPYDPSYTNQSDLSSMYPDNEYPGMHPRILWWGHHDTTEGQLVTPAPGTGTYANTNFRVLASVVDFWAPGEEVVPECEYAVPPPDPGPPTGWSAAQSGAYKCGIYESYVRRIFNFSPHVPVDQGMRTMCLQAPWRYPDLPTLATAYNFNSMLPGSGSAQFAAVGIQPNVWTRTGSSGWMMTIGDLTRLMLAVENLTVIDQTTRNAMLDNTMTTTVPFPSGTQQYMLGTWLATQQMTVPGTIENGFEHSGNVNGYSAYYRMIRPAGRPSIGVALLCNGTVLSAPMRTLATTLIDLVDQDFEAGAPPITYDPTGACSGEADAMGDLLGDWYDTLHARWLVYLVRAGGSSAGAERLVRTDLAAVPGGPDVLRAWDSGDTVEAARLLIPILQRGY